MTGQGEVSWETRQRILIKVHRCIGRGAVYRGSKRVSNHKKMVILWYNKNIYLVFVPSSCHRASKMLSICEWGGEGEYLLLFNLLPTMPVYTNEMSLGGPLDSFRMGLVARGLEGWKFQPYTWNSGEWRGARGWDNHQWSMI